MQSERRAIATMVLVIILAFHLTQSTISAALDLDSNSFLFLLGNKAFRLAVVIYCFYDNIINVFITSRLLSTKSEWHLPQT